LLELILGILLAAGALFYVLRPIFRPSVFSPLSLTGDEGDDPDDDLSAQAVALRALKEIEFDRATGKLSDVDYDALHAQYQAAALAALRGEQGAGSGTPRPMAAPRSPLPALRCPVDGPRPEVDAVFCSTCGRRLADGASEAGYCARCGTTLEPEALFCARCGTRIAA
jgi:double zinc ribbon protein